MDSFNPFVVRSFVDNERLDVMYRCLRKLGDELQQMIEDCRQNGTLDELDDLISRCKETYMHAKFFVCAKLHKARPSMSKDEAAEYSFDFQTAYDFQKVYTYEESDE